MKFHEIPYERLDFERLKEEFRNLMEESANAGNAEEQFAVHKKYYQIMDKVSTTYAVAHIRHDGNVKDAFYEEEYAYYDQIMPKIGDLDTAYKKQLFHSPYKAELMEKIGSHVFKNIELQLKSFDSKLIPFMQEENALKSQYGKLIASAEIEFDGEILNLSLLRKYLISSDREVRKKAHAKRSRFFLENAETLDEIFDKLVKNRQKQAEEMGYPNYVELGYCHMVRNCYDQDMVKVFRDQVKQYVVPFCSQLEEIRRRNLGLHKLTMVDDGMYFANGNPSPTGTPEEILKAAQQMYAALSAETKEFFDFMMENELFDVFGRKNKKAGGYQANLPDYQSPFIFANFNGTSSDVDVMTHECGHAFQAYTARNLPVREHRGITYETAEIHSMSMEFFTAPWMELFFSDRAQAYRQMHFIESICFLPYGCMVDEFQHIVYENPDMTPAGRKQAWMALEKQYRPYMDYDGDPFFGNGGRWQAQQHIYTSPFYYIDYCLAMTCALQFQISMDAGPGYSDAWNRYLNLCKASASGYFTDLIKDAGLDSPFAEGTVRKIVEKLRPKFID